MQFRDRIFNAFRAELQPYLRGDSTVVPLGNFARAFCERAIGSMNPAPRLIVRIPHPSSRQWRDLEQSKIQEIQTLLRWRRPLRSR